MFVTHVIFHLRFRLKYMFLPLSKHNVIHLNGECCKRKYKLKFFFLFKFHQSNDNGNGYTTNDK